MFRNVKNALLCACAVSACSLSAYTSPIPTSGVTLSNGRQMMPVNDTGDSDMKSAMSGGYFGGGGECKGPEFATAAAMETCLNKHVTGYDRALCSTPTTTMPMCCTMHTIVDGQSTSNVVGACNKHHL